MFLKISQNSQEEKLCQGLYFNKVTGLRSWTLAQMFSRKFCGILNCFYGTLLVAASVNTMISQTAFEKNILKLILRKWTLFFKSKIHYSHFTLIKLDLASFESLKQLETRNEVKFRFAMKRVPFTLHFTAGEMKYNFVSRWIGTLKNFKKPERDTDTSMLGDKTQTFNEVLRSVNTTDKNSKFLRILQTDLTTYVADFKLLSQSDY